MGMSDRNMLILVGLIVVGGGLVVTGGVGDLFSSTSQPGGGSSDEPVDDDATAKIELKVNDPLSNSQPNYVNASYYVYNPDGVEVASGTTDTSSGFSSISELKENTEYRIVVQDDDGSGSDYYFNEITHTTSETTDRVIVDAEKEGSVTTDIFETSGSTDDDDTLSVSQGASETMSVEIEENTQDATFKNPALAVKTNDTNAVSELEVVDGTQVDSVPDRLSSFDDVYDLNADELTDFESQQFDVQVTRDSSNSDVATVDMTVIDKSHFQNDEGEWVSGFEDSNDNDVGASDTSTNQVRVE